MQSRTIRRRIAPIWLILIIAFVFLSQVLLDSYRTGMLYFYHKGITGTMFTPLGDGGLDTDEIDDILWQSLHESSKYKYQTLRLAFMTDLFWIGLLLVVATFPVVRYTCHHATGATSSRSRFETQFDQTIEPPRRKDPGDLYDVPGQQIQTRCAPESHTGVPREAGSSQGLCMKSNAVRRRVAPIWSSWLLAVVALAFYAVHTFQASFLNSFGQNVIGSMSLTLAGSGIDVGDIDDFLEPSLERSAFVYQRLRRFTLLTNLFWVLLLIAVAVFPVVRHEIRDPHDKPEPEPEPDTERATETSSPSRSD